MRNDLFIRNLLPLAAAALIAALGAAPVAAQDSDGHRPILSIAGGVTQYDLSGTGASGFGAVRAYVPLSRVFAIEPGITYMSYLNQGRTEGPRWHMWFPEVQLQAQLPLGRVQPYLGAGAGFSHERIDGRSFTDPVASVAAGLRFTLPAGFTAGGELRVRAVDPFIGTTADWGVSIGRRL